VLPFCPMSFLPENLTPAFRSPWHAECGASPESISSSDGHEIFKVLRGLCLNFSKETGSFPYIQEGGKVGENADFSTLLDTKRKIMI
jgi:hypothetical protein